jgi:PAS domain S-box-containing protein
MAYHAEAEHAAAHARARLEAVLDSVGEGVFIDSADGRAVNQAGREILRIPEGMGPAPEGRLFELDGTPILDEEMPWTRAAGTGESIPYRIRTTRRDGLTRIIEGTAAPVFATHGEQIGTVTTIRDVTEEHARQLLTERLLEQLFEALPTAVAVAHPDSGEIVSANAAFGALVGYAPEELVGSCPPYPWWADAPAPDLTSLAGTDESNAEALFRRRDGRLVPVDIAPFLVREEGGEPVAAVGLVTDLSEKRRFEQQIVQSGKLAAIGELAAGVAHEINNPLFAILGLVEFLLKDSEPGTKAHERLELIQQTGLEIKDVVRALLDFARERSDEFEVIILSDVLEQTVDLVRRTTLRKEIELVERYGPEPLCVHASAGQLKQIVLNLVTNAQQAMGDSGTITVDLEREGACALVRVADTGPGIPADVLDRIFDPFFTTKREIGGTGLGLSLSQSIAVGHGGTLVAASPPGGGAEFTLRLPLEERRP